MQRSFEVYQDQAEIRARRKSHKENLRNGKVGRSLNVSAFNSLTNEDSDKKGVKIAEYIRSEQEKIERIASSKVLLKNSSEGPNHRRKLRKLGNTPVKKEEGKIDLLKGGGLISQEHSRNESFSYDSPLKPPKDSHTVLPVINVRKRLE